MSKEEPKRARRRRRSSGRPLLAGTTATALSMMSCTACGNLVPPPQQTVCFDISPETATVTEYSGYEVSRTSDRCFTFHGYYDSIEIEAPGYCTQEFRLSALQVSGEAALSPAPCVDGGVRDAGVDQGGLGDGGAGDGGLPDGSLPDASVDAATDSGTPDGDAG